MAQLRTSFIASFLLSLLALTHASTAATAEVIFTGPTAPVETNPCLTPVRTLLHEVFPTTSLLSQMHAAFSGVGSPYVHDFDSFLNLTVREQEYVLFNLTTMDQPIPSEYDCGRMQTFYRHYHSKDMNLKLKSFYTSLSDTHKKQFIQFISTSRVPFASLLESFQHHGDQTNVILHLLMSNAKCHCTVPAPEPEKGTTSDSEDASSTTSASSATSRFSIMGVSGAVMMMASAAWSL